MKFTLTENANDSLRRAIRYFAENSPSGLKASVKELVSALELLVKEYLVLKDLDPTNPVLLYDRLKIGIDRSGARYVLTRVGLNTVTFDQALERLDWIGHSIGKADVEQLKALKRLRNAVEHLEIEASVPVVRTIFAAAMGFVFRFMEVYIQRRFLDTIDDTDWRTALLLEPELRNSAELSARQVFSNLVAAEHRAIGVATCASCGADCMISYESYWGGYQCVVCGFKHDVETCYGCNRTVFLRELTETEGGTAMCDECVHKYYP